MSRENDFIARLRPAATHPAARGLLDDAAVLAVAGRIVLTHDMIVEGVHFLAEDMPADIAWKLVAVNLSDLAAKGARPIGVLAGCGLGQDAGWDAAFADGLVAALDAFAVPLLGGDTVALPDAAPRTLGLTAIGQAPEGDVPDRRGARAGDGLWVTGRIGDAGLGLALARAGAREPATLLDAYRRPVPRLAAGARLAPLVTAMTDVSDGLLIDASRMAVASGLAATIDLALVPLSAAARSAGLAPVAAATSGDDYELLFAAPATARDMLLILSQDLDVTLTRIGMFETGAGLTLTAAGAPVPLPEVLGYEHGT